MSLENWLNREPSLKVGEQALIQRELGASEEILSDVFGNESESLTKYLDKWKRGVNHFMVSLRDLSNDWIKTYGLRHGLTDTKQLQKNVVRAGVLSDRLEFLNYVIENMILDVDGRQLINVVFPDANESQILTGIEPYEVGTFFPRTEGRERVEGYKDSQVPWIYVFDGESNQYIFLRDRGDSILKRLYAGEIGNLSEEAKEELSRVKAFVLNDHFGLMLVNRLLHRNDKSIISLDGNYSLFYETNPWLAGTLEHETQHLSDFRFLDGTPDCMPLLELRAFSKELLYYQTNGSLYPASIMQGRADSTYGYLESYMDVGRDFRNVTKTHNYKSMKEFLISSIKLLDDSQRKKLTESVASHTIG